MNWTIVGLGFDIVGFLVVFRYGSYGGFGGFLLLEDAKPEPGKAIKISGAAMVVAGFALQMVGATA